MRNHTVNATSPETFRNLKEYQWATNGGELRTDLQETHNWCISAGFKILKTYESIVITGWWFQPL